MYKDFRQYAIKLRDSTSDDQIKLITLLKQAGESVYPTTMLRTGSANTAGVFTYDGTDWAMCGTSFGNTLITIKEAIKKLEQHLKGKETSTSTEIKVGNVYLNSVGERCEIIKIQGNHTNYKHSNGNIYRISKDTILRCWKLQKEKQVSNQPKYKTGDKVRVRADLSLSTIYKMEHNSSTDTVTSRMLHYKGKIVTIKSLSTSLEKYLLEEVGGNWTDEMFEGLAEDIPKGSTIVPKYLDRPAKAGDYVERVYDIDYFLAKGNSLVCKVVDVDSSNNIKLSNGKVYLNSNFKVLNPIQPDYPQDHKQVEAPVEASEPSNPKQKLNKKTEKTKMSTTKKTLKETAVTTVSQNKEALIIASKMEAGKILTKQVLKQVKPHVPMLLRGYLDTPLAPIILANAVTMLGNHTENKRVQQVAELMLLSAASTTVGSFNLDKIVDDVLSNVKLPAGVLDGDDE